MILLAASLTLLAWTAARLGAATSTPGDARVTTALRAALWAFATLVAVETVLGAAGCLQPRTTLAALAGVAAAVEITARRRQWRSPVSSRSPTRPWSTVEAALAAALLAALALRLEAGLDRRSFLYDTLSFHMFAPATWIRTGRLAIVPAVFGDPAPAYNPSNVELWFAFLMAPLRSDYLASAG